MEWHTDYAAHAEQNISLVQQFVTSRSRLASLENQFVLWTGSFSPYPSAVDSSPMVLPVPLTLRTT
jgi:hypothetical protein